MTSPAAVAPREACIEIPLTAGWRIETANGPEIPAEMPGTLASALRAQKMWRMGDEIRFDESAHWFRCAFETEPAQPGEEVVLRIGGLATLAEVTLNGERILESNSMFARHEINVSSLLRERNELTIAFRPLAAALREKRGRGPAARWRTRVVSEQQLRWFRTTLLGRAPGFSPEPQAVGPWRPLTLVRRSRIAIDHWSRQVRIDGSEGIVAADVRIRRLDPETKIIAGRLTAGSAEARFQFTESGDHVRARAVVHIPRVARWWPHTHGDPALYPVHAEFEFDDGLIARFDDIPAGFRSIDPAEEALAVRINGVPIFCRGVVWTPPDVVTLASPPEILERRLRLLRDGGLNLIRVAGTTFYESEDFHRLCDRLGILVWQDMMFANMDYPFGDADFHEAARAEAEAELSRISRHPSTAVICGNSEVEQQAAMLGLDPSAGRGSFFGEELPRIAAQFCPGVPYIPSAPCGGALPFLPASGVANYFGVGAYLRPLEDARRADVKFASECLAFANVPEPETIEKMAPVSPTHPAWKRATPRDAGAGWDFEDVRDRYLEMLYRVDATMLRYADPARYWDLSRVVTGEAMAEVFGEWRRPASSCNGGIVLWAADLEPGAGWGILDSGGWPKAAYWFLKRALASPAVWMTDEGLNGIDIHAANDSPAAMSAVLRVALYRHSQHKIAEADLEIVLPAHQAMTFGVEKILGRFVDAAYAYRFGPPGHDLIVASLHARRGEIPISQAFRFPAGRSTERVPIDDLGIAIESRSLGSATEILISARRFVWGVRITARDFRASDSYFGLEPGVTRSIVLMPLREQTVQPKAVITAINAEGRLTI